MAKSRKVPPAKKPASKKTSTGKTSSGFTGIRGMTGISGVFPSKTSSRKS